MSELLNKLDSIRLRILANIINACHKIINNKKVKIIDLSFELSDLLLRNPNNIISDPNAIILNSHKNSSNKKISMSMSSDNEDNGNDEKETQSKMKFVTFLLANKIPILDIENMK